MRLLAHCRFHQPSVTVTRDQGEYLTVPLSVVIIWVYFPQLCLLILCANVISCRVLSPNERVYKSHVTSSLSMIGFTLSGAKFALSSSPITAVEKSHVTLSLSQSGLVTLWREVIMSSSNIAVATPCIKKSV